MSRFAELSRSGGRVCPVKLALCAVLLASAAGAQSSADWRIDTFAGSGGVGDGGPAVQARLAYPEGLATDSAGNLYIADSGNSQIRKIDSTGTITTIAGTGGSGFGGDDGPAVEAYLTYPTGVAVDGAGNLYIADKNNHRIRKVDSTGTITTIAGLGETRFDGDGFGGDGGPAVQARLAYPCGVATDGAGNLYIADMYNHRIRKVDSTGTITTIAGSGETGFDGDGFGGDGGPAVQARLAYPCGVATDGAGNLYIADKNNHRIRKMDSTGTITTIAGLGELGGHGGFSGDGGPATEAYLSYPTGVAVDGAGNLYIADTSNLRIRKVDSTGTITTVAGSGKRGDDGDGSPATEASLTYPTGVAVDGAGNLYIADWLNHRIRKVDATGTITTIAGSGEYGRFGGDGGPATEARLDFPTGVAVDGAGNLFIADRYNHRIRKVDATRTITTIAGLGESGGYGGFSGDGGPAVQAQLDYPTGVAVDGAGNLYIADRDNHRIGKVDFMGTITTIAGLGEPGGYAGFSGDGGPAVQAQLSHPRGVAVNDAGNLYIADTYNHRIRKVDSTGTITTIVGMGERGVVGGGFGGDGGPAVQAYLNYPTGVAVDGAGNLYIADRNNHRIRTVDSTGTITTIAGTGGSSFGGDGGPAVEARLAYPWDVAVDGAGNLYIADKNNHRIRKVDATGTITTIAGSGERGDDGDGGPAVQAQLYSPYGVATDGAGNLYIADTRNHRIRVLTPMTGDGTVPARARTAPEDEQAFHRLVVGQRMLTDYPSYNVDFVTVGRFKETVGAETYTGSYSYSNTGVNTGDVVLNYDDGDRCTIHVVFTSTTAGTANSTCTDGESLQSNWRLTQIPAGERAPLFEEIRGLLQL